jgi:hypothetical protein
MQEWWNVQAIYKTRHLAINIIYSHFSSGMAESCVVETKGKAKDMPYLGDTQYAGLLWLLSIRNTMLRSICSSLLESKNLLSFSHFLIDGLDREQNLCRECFDTPEPQSKP